MDKIALDSSSDEDDPYTNSVARLRALKKQRFESDEPVEIVKNIEQQTNGEEMKDGEVDGSEMNGKEINGNEVNGQNEYVEEIRYGVQTRSRTVRGRRNRNIIARANRITATTTRGRRKEGRYLPENLECDVEVTGEVKPKSTLQSNDDIITLSDEDTYKEDDNYEINIKVHWRSNRLDRLSMCRHDSFKKIFEYYANLEKVSVNEILIMKKDKIINHADTPASLKLSIIDILDGGIVNPGMNTTEEKNNDEDMCSIKVQTANKKQSLTIPLRKDEGFKALFANCAKQLNVKEKDLKFYFDGEQIDPTDTPESLDLEGEACIDLHIST
ncbi:PREDICTED: uncharacterized protein CG4449 isoform X1 [Vollenhovia emeryi]|uniref:uncharacterized protein CG4449 isoform X1 n=1 Tax=Vollenhovia emeryi TaxID=411798 RepID=UPI0005F56BC3|nr:PREDICTED: uncharacterized protein CG4449 isoform X1 [Vollenhovia emeryi]XP_011876549.1 PREDICTED: uncharacterized protein CG4449 isoform X1 [Vollenhovia emeryi]XP_011876552.1 PREDICTED: uncharacterized protein CG4449 isoform X1 [Vollenhovia emeryi]